MVTNAVASIEQTNKTAGGFDNCSRRDFEFFSGDKVLISTKYVIPDYFRDRKRKLAAKFAGPNEIIEVLSTIYYLLKLPIWTKAHNVFHASMLNPYHDDSKTNRTALPHYQSLFETWRQSSRRRGGERGQLQSASREAAVPDQIGWLASVGVNVGK
jgi:hypothetical protein